LQISVLEAPARSRRERCVEILSSCAHTPLASSRISTSHSRSVPVKSHRGVPGHTRDTGQTRDTRTAEPHNHPSTRYINQRAPNPKPPLRGREGGKRTGGGRVGIKNGLHVWRSQTPQTRVTVKSENIKLCFESAVSGGTSRAPALARLLFPSTISTFSSESFELELNGRACWDTSGSSFFVVRTWAPASETSPSAEFKVTVFLAVRFRFAGFRASMYTMTLDGMNGRHAYCILRTKARAFE